MEYDPDVAPNPQLWLRLDEGERIQRVVQYHEAKRVKLPNLRMHATMHSIAENQIAEGLPSVIRTMTRLQEQGLSRHDAIHAVASVVTEMIFDVLKPPRVGGRAFSQTEYDAKLDRLTAESWLAEFDE